MTLGEDFYKLIFVIENRRSAKKRRLVEIKRLVEIERSVLSNFKTVHFRLDRPESPRLKSYSLVSGFSDYGYPMNDS